MPCRHTPPDALDDRLSHCRERPLLSPRIVQGPILTLAYTDARGQQHALTMTERGLAELQISIAEAQSRIALAHLQKQDVSQV